MPRQLNPTMLSHLTNVQESGEGAEITFSVDGKSGSFDVTNTEAAAFLAFAEGDETALYKMLTKRGTVGKSGNAATSSTSHRAAAGQIKLPDNRTVPSDDFRAWATANNFSTSQRGRQPGETLAAYISAHPASPASTPAAPDTNGNAPAAASAPAATPAATPAAKPAGKAKTAGSKTLAAV